MVGLKENQIKKDCNRQSLMIPIAEMHHYIGLGEGMHPTILFNSFGIDRKGKLVIARKG